ncbi:CHAP domain-containing protein [Teredinibacter turnerae]|uniref:CHAP domain-containing protein n=1 Tax=Teredinibacter turnerae TaxID=2426 RepID=UPI000380612B|nr:CHAP domain-containing protein [Teredinibacter turnerae]
MAGIAAKYLGVKETGDNLAGNSKELLAIFKADNLAPGGRTDGYPWCAAFVSFCVQALQKQSAYFGALNPPREASVSLFLNQWAKNAGCSIYNNKNKNFEARKGDIVVFVFSHIGIVESVNGSTLQTIEGNTNDSGSREGNIVARKNRAKSLIKAYIRLPISTSKMTHAIEEMARCC